MTHFKAQFDSQSYHAHAWLTDWQKEAFHVAVKQGLPTRKSENWKYTSLERLKKTTFDGVAVTGIADKEAIIVQDGKVTTPEAIPEGVVICDLFTALKKEDPFLKKPGFDNFFATLNLALLEGGVFIHVGKGVSLRSPIEVRIQHSDNSLSHHLQNVYLIEEEANASIIETYHSEVEASYFHNVVSTITVKESAVFHYYKIVNEAHNAFHIGNTSFDLSEHAKAYSHVYSFGGALSRSEVSVNLNEKGADCYLNGIYVVGDTEQVASYTTQNHLSPHANSTENYKGIVGGSASAVFNGNIHVEKDAQKTNASLENKNILLSSKASVDTKPQLEIFADDVKCAHGTTVGQLDDKAVFYLRSRGIPLSEARELLVHAFAGDILDKIPDEELKQSLQQTLNDKLRKVA